MTTNSMGDSWLAQMKKCQNGIVISYDIKGASRNVGEGYVEFTCNLPMPHPNIGQHAYKADDFTITWEVTGDEVLMA